MDVELSRLINSVAADSNDESMDGDAMKELLSSLSHRPVPTGRVARLWSMGSVQARLVITYALSWMRERFASPEEKEALRDEAHLQAAARLFAGMGYLRGAALKVGQTLASFPEVAPRQYVEVLSALHAQAPPMHFSLLREQVRAELGADPEELFASFETEAFAAASFGQVHRARLKSGEPVAVKVQYPNIARTVDADFGALKLLTQSMPFLRDWNNKLEILEDMRTTLVEETDYRRELANAEKVRSALAEMTDVVVPVMYPELSSERVLTMELLSGMHLPAFLESHPSQEARDHHATRILRASYRLWCDARLIHSDQNPGNYLFLDDGRLGLLDFGCVRHMDEAEWQTMLLSIEATRGGDAELRSALREISLLTDEDFAEDERMRFLTAFCDWMWEPIRTDEPFDFSDGRYLERGCTMIVECMKKQYTRSLPMITWLDRMLMGVRALFTQLEARIPYKQVNDEELARAGL